LIFVNFNLEAFANLILLMPIINLKKTKLLLEPCINTFLRSKDTILSILINNNWCWILKLISVMFQANYIIIKQESHQCQKKRINRDKEQLTSPITTQKWNNLILDHLEIPKWRLCPSAQEASTWLIQTAMGLSCKNNIRAPCTEVINSIQVFPVTNTIIKKPNTHPKA